MFFINRLVHRLLRALLRRSPAADTRNHHPGLRFRGDWNRLTIGENVSFGGNVSILGGGPVSIGDHTMIAANVVLHTSTHDHKQHPMWSLRIDRPIVIGKHVWIGTGAIVLAGVKIEDYAVVGAGSVVQAHVPTGRIVGGVPARLIGSRDLRNLEHGGDLAIQNREEATVESLGLLPESDTCKSRAST